MRNVLQAVMLRNSFIFSGTDVQLAVAGLAEQRASGGMVQMRYQHNLVRSVLDRLRCTSATAQFCLSQLVACCFPSATEQGEPDNIVHRRYRGLHRQVCSKFQFTNRNVSILAESLFADHRGTHRRVNGTHNAAHAWSGHEIISKVSEHECYFQSERQCRASGRLPVTLQPPDNKVTVGLGIHVHHALDSAIMCIEFVEESHRRHSCDALLANPRVRHCEPTDACQPNLISMQVMKIGLIQFCTYLSHLHVLCQDCAEPSGLEHRNMGRSL